MHEQHRADSPGHRPKDQVTGKNAPDEKPKAPEEARYPPRCRARKAAISACEGALPVKVRA